MNGFGHHPAWFPEQRFTSAALAVAECLSVHFIAGYLAWLATAGLDFDPRFGLVLMAIACSSPIAILAPVAVHQSAREAGRMAHEMCRLAIKIARTPAPNDRIAGAALVAVPMFTPVMAGLVQLSPASALAVALMSILAIGIIVWLRTAGEGVSWRITYTALAAGICSHLFHASLLVSMIPANDIARGMRANLFIGLLGFAMAWWIVRIPTTKDGAGEGRSR